MRQINDTTFISDNLGELKPLVTIGGKPVDKFIPNLNMSFHDDEFFINLNRRDKQAINTTDKAEIDGIDKDIFYIDENGRFKWDIEFKERPSKNSWTWELKHAEGIEFYYQGELTAEEIADGCERPLEAIGSYAVYCNKANNKYKTGKLCHIYRPFCYDINGKSIYADLKISDGQLSITIDETWLDNAVYPVRLDPTIGYTTLGGSLSNSDGYILCDNYSNAMAESGSASKIYAGGRTNVSCSPSLGYYNSGPTGSVIGSASFSASSAATIWFSISTSGDLTNGLKYHASMLGVNGFDIAFDSGSSGDSKRGSYTSWATNPSLTNLSARLSLYLEYTESGGNSLPAIINNYRQQGVM